MRNLAQFYKGLADETRLRILWLLMLREELCVCDIMRVLGITQSKASRHLRYLYNLGLVTDRRQGVWMNYRLAVDPDSHQGKLLQLLRETFATRPEARDLSQRLQEWLRAKQEMAAKEATTCVC